MQRLLGAGVYGLLPNGAALETSLGMILGSALFNPVGIVAIFLLFAPPMAVARVAFELFAILVWRPLWPDGTSEPLCLPSSASTCATSHRFAHPTPAAFPRMVKAEAQH